MYLPDNLSNNVHLMKISPFRFASSRNDRRDFATVATTEETSQVATADEISLQSQRQRGFRCSRNDREDTFNQITKSRFPEVQKQILG